MHCDRRDLPRVAEWKSNKLHDVVHVFWVGYAADIYYTNPARHSITADFRLDI